MAVELTPPADVNWGLLPRKSVFRDGSWPVFEDQFKVLPRSEWQEVRNRRHVKSVYSQLDGMCAGNAAAGALMVLRSQLIQRKQALIQNVADKQLDGKDAVITAIMPGGLLYAGYKKVRYEQAKNELDRVSTDIEEYSGDLVAMQSRAAPVAVAWLP